jgi:hypothetical protein
VTTKTEPGRLLADGTGVADCKSHIYRLLEFVESRGFPGEIHSKSPGRQIIWRAVRHLGCAVSEGCSGQEGLATTASYFQQPHILGFVIVGGFCAVPIRSLGSRDVLWRPSLMSSRFEGRTSQARTRSVAARGLPVSTATVGTHCSSVLCATYSHRCSPLRHQAQVTGQENESLFTLVTLSLPVPHTKIRISTRAKRVGKANSRQRVSSPILRPHNSFRASCRVFFKSSESGQGRLASPAKAGKLS